MINYLCKSRIQMEVGSGDTARPGKPEALIRINYFSETFASINF